MSSKYVTVKSKGLNTLAKRYGDKFKEIIRNKSLLTDLGNEIVKDVRFQARRGRTTDKDGSQGSMDKLKKSTVDKRKDLASRGIQTAQAYSPSRSNLTLSGQLLDSLTITKIEAGSVTVGFTGIHKGYSVPYLPYFVRKKNKRKERVNRGPIKGFQSSHGGMSYVNTNRTGNTKANSIPNEQLASYVQDKRPFMNLRKEFVERLKTLVIRFIRRNLK